MKRLLLAWFAVAYWWLMYRDAGAARRRRLKLLIAATYAVPAIAFAVRGEWLFSAVGLVLIGGTLGLMLLVDHDIVDRRADERARREARRAAGSRS